MALGSSLVYLGANSWYSLLENHSNVLRHIHIAKNFLTTLIYLQGHPWCLKSLFISLNVLLLYLGPYAWSSSLEHHFQSVETNR